MDVYNLSTVTSETDLIRTRLQMRARAIELIRQMVAVRREDWHFYLNSQYLLTAPNVTEQDRARLPVLFAEMERKHAKIRQDICDTIQLVRNLDDDSYADVGPHAEH